MKTSWTPAVTILATLLLAAEPAAFGQAQPNQSVPNLRLETGEGESVAGRFELLANGVAQFVAGKGNQVTTLEAGMAVDFPGKGPDAAAGLPPFRLDLGIGQRLCGRLGKVDDDAVVLLETAGSRPIKVARSGVQSLIQRSGETLVFQDDFESIDSRRWTVVGEPNLADAQHVSGAHSLSLPTSGASLTHTLRQPFTSGRFEVAFHDDGSRVGEVQWFVDLTFRGRTGPETVRAILGWTEDSLAVESPTGPALAVQRLGRKPGWHRLGVRFGKEITEIAVDGNELAHGKGFGGPLIEMRLATFLKDSGKKEPNAKVVGLFDDLRLTKYSEPVGSPEIDATQDEVRLISGDQVFGSIRKADGERVKIAVDGGDHDFSWGEITGVYFKRSYTPAAAIEGLLVRATWRSSAGDDRLDVNEVEGALKSATPDTVKIETAYAGLIEIPTERLIRLTVQGRGRRIVIDPAAHHLGDEISTLAPLLDPPQPEGGTLERSFDLGAVPEGPVFLVLDVIQVVGEQADIPTFSDMIKRGELRTNVKINGEPFDYLNRYVKSRNETSERIRIPIPREHLRPGKNVIRFEQGGTANDPNYLDDLGVLCVAVEFPIPRPAPAVTPP